MRVCPVAGVVIGRQLVGRTRFEGVVPSFAVRMPVILLHLVLVLFVVVLETCRRTNASLLLEQCACFVVCIDDKKTIQGWPRWGGVEGWMERRSTLTRTNNQNQSKEKEVAGGEESKEKTEERKRKKGNVERIRGKGGWLLGKKEEGGDHW